jgi:hypothetical protein
VQASAFILGGHKDGVYCAVCTLESPRWLIANGRPEEAAALIEKAAKEPKLKGFIINKMLK